MGVLITGSGLYTPKQSISNEELVASYNTYVDSYNNENKLLIDTGEIEPLIHSDTDFIKKVSGIEQRFVLDKEGNITFLRIMNTADPTNFSRSFSLQGSRY